MSGTPGITNCYGSSLWRVVRDLGSMGGLGSWIRDGVDHRFRIGRLGHQVGLCVDAVMHERGVAA